MKTLQSFVLLLFFTICHNVTTGVYSQCLKDQQLSLLHLKKNLTFDDHGSPVSSKFVSWDSSTDCCSWLGVTCSSNGRVVGLDISRQRISGPILEFFSNFSNLTVLNLDRNNISAPVPGFFANFSKLTTLSLRDCGLNGTFPKQIFQVPTLQTLDLSFNLELHGSLPEFPKNGSLRSLILSQTSFSGLLHDSIGNLNMLSTLDLYRCNFTGSIPKSIGNLTKLAYLSLSSNMFNGPISSIHWENLINLVHLSLYDNQLVGSIPSSLFSLPLLPGLVLSHNNLSGQLPEFFNVSSSLISKIDLSFNYLEGPVPVSIFNFRGLELLFLSSNNFSAFPFNGPHQLPNLTEIDLSHNNLSGQLPEFFNVSSSLIACIDLSFNYLEGPVPVSIFNFRGLQQLFLSSNNFNAFPFNGLHQLPNLTEIDLSHNSLLVLYNGSNSSYSSFPQLAIFNLVSNKLRTFPVFLRNQTYLTQLDLSENQIQGQLPNWIWKLDSLDYLNVSYNALESLEGPFINSTSRVSKLDLHSNQLKGPISIVPPYAQYLDYSNNHFSSSIPVSICNASHLRALDLSSNSLSGEIPQCLAAMSTLMTLNVRKNNITGMISNLEFPESLEALDLSQNQIEGQFPKSLARCRRLIFLNLAENQITDTFPCLLKNISTLIVLALRSNNFYGGIGCPVVKTNATWPVLQILDLAYNNFNGEVPGFSLTTWHAMKDNTDIGFLSTVNVSHHLSCYTFGSTEQGIICNSAIFTYEPTITITSKGLKMDLAKIPSVLTLIDFSCNNFSGSIPKEMGALKSLYFLNLSSNAFTGEIPSSFGNMRQLESLDLSQNKLSGQIPQQLAKLNFLEFLNLSNNQLVGKIPAGTQISTFPRDSFTGNKGLWGPPLMVDSKARLSPPPTLNGSHPNSTYEIDWDLISVEIGFVFGFAVAVGSLVFFKRWSKWYYRSMYKILVRIFPQLEERIGPHRRDVHINQRRRR